MWRIINGKRYYYVKEREGNKVKSIYVKDPALIQFYEYMKEAEALRRSIERRKIENLKAVQKLILNNYRNIFKLVRLNLFKNGYLLTRGQIRKVRGEKMKKELDKQFKKEIERLKNGEIQVGWFQMGVNALLELIKIEDKDKALLRAQAEYDLQVIREKLSYNTSSEVEKMLIDLIAFTNFEVNYYRSLTHRNGYIERLYDNAVRRYMKAIETLDKIRKKNIIFVNIANEQQINFKGGQR